MTDIDSGSAPIRLSYAIGDLHGRLDLLKSAIAAIADHVDRRSFRLVFLGDYVDRGPDSRGVIDLLITLHASGRAICLKGNHEALMLEAVTSPDPGAKRRWLQNGGAETLKSYGLDPDGEFRDAIPSSHVRWIAGLPLTTADPHRIFVHAGLMPRSPVHRQTEQTLLWIRERFLEGDAADFDAHVVHGHTPVWGGKPEPGEPELLAHRTNLDTAAFTTGVLTVGVFDAQIPGRPVEVLRVTGPALPHLAHGLSEGAEEPARPRRRRAFGSRRVG